MQVALLCVAINFGGQHSYEQSSSPSRQRLQRWASQLETCLYCTSGGISRLISWAFVFLGLWSSLLLSAFVLIWFVREFHLLHDCPIICRFWHAFKELAIGLEASDCSFLWIVGSLNTHGMSAAFGTTERVKEFLPLEIEERMKGRGMSYSGWAPQTRIFKHPAVDGFLSQCW